MKSYRIVELFRTIQGEGFHAGRASVFVRFAGCNLWSGNEETRARDADRHGAKCPLWCDTDFRVGTPMTASEVALAVRDQTSGIIEHVVLTGGEPLLHIDVEFITELRRWNPNITIAIETNGTVLPRDGVELARCEWALKAPHLIDWVCVSPKVPMSQLKLTTAHELKVVVPDYDPLEYGDFDADFYYVQPRAQTSAVGVSVLDRDSMRRAAAFVMLNPTWKLGIQSHKVVGLQ